MSKREQYEKEKGLDVYASMENYGSFKDEYVKWLELELEKQAKNNEVLDLVSECCGNPDIIQKTVTYQAPYETLDEMELTICRKCKKSISAKFSNFR